MSKYRKRPVIIDAFQWTGDQNQTEDPTWIIEALNAKKVKIVGSGKLCIMSIETLEGVMTGRVGDFIIKGVQGEIYPCKPDIFNQTYEKVDE